MIKLKRTAKDLVIRELTIENDPELLARLQKLIRRRKEAEISEVTEGQKLYDAALVKAAAAARTVWPEEDLTLPEGLLNTEDEDLAVKKILAGRHFDKPEDFSYYINAETLREMIAQ